MPYRTRFSTAIGLENQVATGNYLGEQRNQPRTWYSGAPLEDFPGDVAGCTPEARWVDGSPGPAGVFDKEACCAPPVAFTVDCIGGGGGAFRGASPPAPCGGGGGGGCSRSSYTVPSGTVFSVQVGGGGTGGLPPTAGVDTWFGSSTTQLAKGGLAGALNVGGLGGQAAAGIGTTKTTGGTGGTGVVSGVGGGGGAGADPTGNGANGANNAGGAGASPGGNGGNGGGIGGNGANGSQAGGGGGARGAGSGTSGNGGVGMIRILLPTTTVFLGTADTSWTVP